MAGRVVLCVGYGVSDTVAVVVGGDGRWVPVRFDGADMLSSAVFVDPNGSLSAGAAAWQSGTAAPERFEVAPLRWLPAGEATVAATQVPLWDMVTATLKLVAEHARALLGGTPVDEVRLVVPAAWGPRRRTAMRQAAWQAGLGQPELVTAAQAVAGFAATNEAGVRVGSFVAVCELDGEAAASVLLRGPYGFEVLSTVEAQEAGSLAWDGSLASQLAGLAPNAMVGDTVPGRWMTALASAREARRAAQFFPAVTVAGPAGPVVLPAAAVVAGVYAILGSVILNWGAGPFLRWTLLPLTPTVLLVLVTAALATRGRRIPATGWHVWLGFPVSSVFVATAGMVAVQAAVTTSVYPSHATALILLGRAGGAALGVAAVLATARRARWRIIGAPPAAVLCAAVTGWSTTGILVCVYAAAVSLWWVRRVWLLANRPHTALPYPV